MVAQIGQFGARRIERDPLGPVMAQGVPLRDLVGIDLVAAMKHQREGLPPVLVAQARPHGVALGILAVEVARLLAIAGDIGEAQIAGEVAGKLVGVSVPPVRGRPVCWQREPHPPDPGMVELREGEGGDCAGRKLDRRRLGVPFDDEESRKAQETVLDIVEDEHGADDVFVLRKHPL